MSDSPADLSLPSHRPDLDRPDEAAPSPLAVLSKLSTGQMLSLGMTLIGLLGFFAYLTFRIVEPDYQLLYGGLDLEDSAEIVARLESLGVPYELHASGETVLVPADRVARLRMSMAEEGLPRGGSVGDEIFDEAGALGTTTFLANINQRRALEGELSRTIAALKDVKAARVHLVLPKRELFRREQIEPSASVTLRMYGGRRLDQRQVAAVQHLVAAAVPGLQPNRITLVDDRGTLLVRGGEVAVGEGMASRAEDYRIAYEARLKRVVEQLLERSIGAGRVHAEVNADMDFDQVTMTEETFDPDGQVVRSTQSIEEESEVAERDQDGAVTVGNNLPNANAGAEEGGRTNNENTLRTEETVNYEISRTVRNHTQVGGRLKRLSVAVLVGGRETTVEDAVEPVYTPLAQEELDEIAQLVRSAIGFDAERGDSVDVKNMPFVQPDLEEIDTSMFDFTKNDLLRLIELGVLLILAVLAIFVVIKPMLAKLSPEPVTLDPSMSAPDIEGSSNLPVVFDENGNPILSPDAGDGTDQSATTADDETAALPEFEDKFRLGLIQQVRNVIEARPDDAVAVVRLWMKQSMEADNG
ncbi:MAG: flagellar basal-body MS-ring/collar protein FliF [Geminicoccales bacterium]